MEIKVTGSNVDLDQSPNESYKLKVKSATEGDQDIIQVSGLEVSSAKVNVSGAKAKVSRYKSKRKWYKSKYKYYKSESKWYKSNCK